MIIVLIEIEANSGLEMDYRFSSTAVGLIKFPLAKLQYTWTSAAVLASE